MCITVVLHWCLIHNKPHNNTGKVTECYNVCDVVFTFQLRIWFPNNSTVPIWYCSLKLCTHDKNCILTADTLFSPSPTVCNDGLRSGKQLVFKMLLLSICNINFSQSMLDNQELIQELMFSTTNFPWAFPSLFQYSFWFLWSLFLCSLA